jgi:hypothetical protein
VIGAGPDAGFRPIDAHDVQVALRANPARGTGTPTELG